ncbi:lactonase family protein [Paenibacillus beijingensis]|uniref:lactonase family protein n=1 Tax=Paenibacillus beijingensis TaxID=1126833 RepID=UPI000A64A308|nr:lactonase family protein [Paenibacillus beijingensis]
MANQQQLLVFAGSYAERENSGVYVYRLNEETLELDLLDEVSGLKNPTFLNVDASSGYLYSIAEGTSAEGGKTGEAVAFLFDAAQGKLTRVNENTTTASPTCHIQRDPLDRYLIVVSYHGGMVGLMEIEEGGRIGRQLDVQQHEGHSVHKRQDCPHPHSTFFSPDGRYLFVQDLGLDIIRTYTLDRENNKLVPHRDNRIHAGAGPRHLTFHPNGQFAFVINELDSTISSLRFDADTGALNEIGSVSTLPDGFDGENTCAEVVISKDGRFLYGSNRGHDSLVVFAVDGDTGALSPIQHVTSGGGHPRHFALAPSGRLIVAANKDTNNIALFRVDPESGRLEYTGRSTEVSQPVCVQPVYVPVS